MNHLAKQSKQNNFHTEFVFISRRKFAVFSAPRHCERIDLTLIERPQTSSNKLHAGEESILTKSKRLDVKSQSHTADI